MRGLALAAALAVVIGAASCAVDPYCVDNCKETDGGAGGDRADALVEDASAPDAQLQDATLLVDGCIPTGPELCNGKDDNCNGQIDEGSPGSGQTCSRNVGECHVGTTMCTGGRLVCMGGVEPMPEECNGKDDDCDGTVDNGDPGGGPPCGSNVGTCTRGALRCMGGTLMCMGGTGPVAELCNGLDDNCDGMIDNAAPDNGPCGSAVGACRAGTLKCVGGTYQCMGAIGPRPELCNSADDNCNGMTDETFSLTTDVRNCGMCGHVCQGMNAIWGCGPDMTGAGVCKVRGCLPGFFNNDGRDDNGCEYACNLQGVEICNGKDDDCNGLVDDALTPPANFCKGVGECSTTRPPAAPMAPRPVCSLAQKTWVCPYGPTVSVDALGNIVPDTKCDGLDNDCNGVADRDTFPTLGNACGNGTGACRTTGSLVCNATQNGVRCNAPAPLTPGVEVCNGQDDDCDGMVDETKASPGTNPSYVLEPMVKVSNSLWVYKYEASRPDATFTVSGGQSARACSLPNVKPWVNVTYPQAVAACQAAGLRLCTEAEWQTACGGTGSCAWGMQPCGTYGANTCNGNDYDPIAGAPDDDLLFPTAARTMAGGAGSPVFPSCDSDWGAAGTIFDMSGNVKEWTQARSAGVNPLRGGSFDNTSGGMRCDFNFTVASNTFLFDNVGFRCCSSTAP